MLPRTGKRVGLAFVLGLFISASTSFASPLLTEPFSYSNGVLAAPTPGNVSGGTWVRTSGSADDLLVSGGKLLLKDTGSDDAARALSSTITSGVIYASFELTGDTLDRTSSTAGSEYLAGFYSSGGAYYGVIAPSVPGGTPSNSYRLGIANDNISSNQILATNLLVSATQLVVVKYDFSTNRTTLWVNPTSELDTNVVATDVPGTLPANFNRYAVRQPSTDVMGDFTMDNLKVATTFAEVIPEPATLGAMLCLGGVLLSRRRA